MHYDPLKELLLYKFQCNYAGLNMMKFTYIFDKQTFVFIELTIHEQESMKEFECIMAYGRSF